MKKVLYAIEHRRRRHKRLRWGPWTHWLSISDRVAGLSQAGRLQTPLGALTEAYEYQARLVPFDRRKR